VEHFVCIHGHFYQPPRENPWLEAIEVEDSAFPYHDWNERISDECYQANASARILDDAGLLEEVVDNYSRISFNFGPTLLSWLEEKKPAVYRAILEADHESGARFSGHCSALAQVYNHVIMPLANDRDRTTEVEWGIADFRRRFGRDPEGMWLPETAVDVASLETLAQHDIKFVILAPHQAAAWREIGTLTWQKTADNPLVTGRAYRVALPSGKTFAAFFYDDKLAHGVAFERVLDDGQAFGRELIAGATADSGPSIHHIATDGETFGHHHRFGEMALAAALRAVETEPGVALTNYGEFLGRFPPVAEVQIEENTSWSCSHGIERWRSDCGCSTGAHPGWNQAWRRPLRIALNRLRDRLVDLYEREAAGYLTDPWRARNSYIDVVLDRAPATIETFFSANATRELTAAERERTLKLLEMQRNALLMFTSCGWFFDDIAGLEAVQVLHYAARAIQLAEDLSGQGLEPPFVADIAPAASNRPAEGSGADIYSRRVKPSQVDLERLAAVFALTSLFETRPEAGPFYAFDVLQEELRTAEAGRTRMSTGRLRVESRITGEAARVSFATVDFGDQNIAGGVRLDQGWEDYDRMHQDIAAAFALADLTDVLRLIDGFFPGKAFSLRSLFRDDQRRILGSIAEPAMEEAESVYRALYEEHIPLIRFLASVGFPMPHRFRAAAEFALNIDLRRAVIESEIDRDRLLGFSDEARLAGISLDLAGIAPVAQARLEVLASAFASARDADSAGRLLQFIEATRDIGIPVNLVPAQLLFYRATHRGGVLENGHDPAPPALVSELARALAVSLA
jgi:alpha-amylase/alpha-mannosidase (GH57 family)